MKRALRIALVIFALFACLLTTACGNVSQEDYDKLNNQYAETLKEKEKLEKVSEWLELYKSIEIGKSVNEIYETFGFEYSLRTEYESEYSDGTRYKIASYTWENSNLFDMNNTAENQIVVVFLDGVAIYKQYGNQRFIFHDGTVHFP